MPGITFLFWNVNGQPLDERVARIVASQQVDVALLAEPGTPGTGLAVQLGRATGSQFFAADTAVRADRFTVCSRLPRRSIRLALDEHHWLLYRVEVDQVPELILALAHLPSKLHTSADTQAVAIDGLVADITDYERRRDHRRTILVGDLNMNPFEPGIVGVRGLHAVMSATVAARGTREVRGRAFRMFYNPMWGLMGDRTPGPPGTFYRGEADAVNYFWNTYDQVLLRPDLSERLDRLAVLDSDGAEPLLTKAGLPDKANASDHLPLLFRLEW